MDREAAAASIMSIGSNDLQEGRNLHAQQVFGSLAKVDFQFQGHARLGEAKAMARNGQLGPAKQKLEGMLYDFQKPIIFRADVLRTFVEVKIALGELDGIDDNLEEAGMIYNEQGTIQLLGAVVHLRAMVATQRGELERALEEYRWATTLESIKIPDVVPVGLGIDQPTEDVYQQNRTPLAGIGLN